MYHVWVIQFEKHCISFQHKAKKRKTLLSKVRSKIEGKVAFIPLFFDFTKETLTHN